QIFHVHTLPDFLVLSTLIPKISGVKIILDFHELFPEAILQFKKGLKKSSFYYKAILLQEKISYNFANYIIVFHDPAKEIINSRYGDKKNAVVIMNGVDETEVSDFRKKKSDNFKIVYNGTINYNLNLSLLIKALIYIKKHHSDVYQKIFFYLYGDGPDLDNILNLARDNQIERVKYCGRLEFKKMIKELETASLCILPPSKDVYSDLFYSLKLIEMIYLKIPVIASKLNTYQIYYPEGCLLYFEPDNETDLAEKILFAYNNPDKLKEYADCAYKQYQKYSWNIMKKRYTDLIQNILCNSQGNRKVVRNCN
ncbi:MAG: glycosyltransferase family 4 protein, partial [Ignavibacteria bacterium]|nr:glycosyltransferase family 4 protein [Ignavibacteria bacterium]